MSQLVVTHSNLFDYFHARVEDARAAETVHVSDDTSLYLATLLAERARTDRPAPPEQTLAELHARAAIAPPAEQARTYRELGDRALYLLGYFAESLRRRTVGPSYYAEMGAAAYYRVDLVFKKWYANAFGPVFAELADHFDECVHLLEVVRTHHEADRPDDVLWLYQRWLQTGSEAIAERLRAMGVVVVRGGDGGSDA